ncbi:MAG: HD domain-containing protein [Candidatus Calescibacterium sp.]|nr:HD domain-containing protein [Candidatus Calescibacterium sp.]MCX7972535.1 HD domain-containing protein [bacterium]MDW8195572.1 HD domain-containing protein [Candidatus Calescibacterium sp.]
MRDELIEKKIEVLEKNLLYKKDPHMLLELSLLYDRAQRFVDAYKKFEELTQNHKNFLKGLLFKIIFLCKWGRKDNFFELVEKYFFIKFFEEVPTPYVPTFEDIRKYSYIINDLLSNIDEYLKLNLNSLLDLLIKAFALFLLKSEEFEKIFQYLFKNFGDNFKVQYLYSLMKIDCQDYTEAIISLKKIIDYNPMFDDAYLLLGYVYLKQNIFNQALVYLKKATELNNKRATPSILLAKYLIMIGKYDDAIEVLHNKAQMIEPNNPLVYYYLAQSYKGKNEYEKALRLYESLKMYNYFFPEIKKEMADIYMLLGEYKQTLKILYELKEESILFDEEVYEKLIIVNERLGNLEQAFLLVKEALSYEEKINFYLIGAKIAFRKGEFDQAYKWFKRVLEYDPRDFETLYSLGIIELSKMKFGISEKYFQDAVNVNPTKNEAKYFLALTYAFQDKIDKAIEILIKVKENIKDPLKSKIVSFNIASAYSFLGDVKKTEEFLYEAIQDFTKYFKQISEQDILFYTTLLFQTRVVYEASRSNKELEESQSQLLQAMLDAIQAKDNYTKDHTQRVTIIAVEIAKAMGLEEEILQTLLVGTLVHDIGKIGIPDNVLNKPGRLTDEEFQIMKQHTIIGYEIIKKMKFPKIKVITSNERFDNIGTVSDCVRYHHEKWDGTGYPDGLKGEKIPLLARIIAVADVFDALMSERQYKKAIPAFKSIEIIDQSKGTHFDPMIVDYFMKIVDDIVIVLYAGGKGTREYYDKSVEELLKMSKEDILGDIGRF